MLLWMLWMCSYSLNERMNEYNRSRGPLMIDKNHESFVLAYGVYVSRLQYYSYEQSEYEYYYWEP